MEHLFNKGVICCKDVDGVVDNVDPDETAPVGAGRSESTLLLGPICQNTYNFMVFIEGERHGSMYLPGY